MNIAMRVGERLEWEFPNAISGSSSDSSVVSATFAEFCATLVALKAGSATVYLTRADSSAATLSISVS